MWRLATAGVVAWAGAAAAAPALKDPPLAGEWRLVEIDGRPPDGFETTEAFGPDGTYRSHTRMADGRVIESRARYTTDRAARPARIDLTDGPSGEPAEGIFQIEGDTLTACVRHGRGSRPTAFKADPGGGASVFVFKRVKPKD